MPVLESDLSALIPVLSRIATALESLVRFAEKQEERASSHQVTEHEKNSFPQART
jgi:hypothetical protein